MKSLTSILLAVVISIFVLFPLYAKESTDQSLLGVKKTLIESTIRAKKLLFERRYDEALTLFDEIKKKYPDSVTGRFGKMAVWQIRMFENEDFRFKREYEAAEKEYEQFSLMQLRKGEVPSWELFVYGAGDGMRGFFRGREGKWFKSLTLGLHAMRMFKQLKWQEPDFIDTNLGFGMYLFWRSVFTSRLKVLPFFKDRREEGYALVKKVAREGRYSRDMALANLVFMYTYDNKVDDALKTANQVLSEYPDNLIIKFLKGKLLLRKKSFNKALAVFDEVYSQDPAINKALLYKGITLFHMKEYEQAKGLLESYLPLETEKDWKATVLYWLGRVAEVEGNKEQAIDYYNKSLKLYKLDPAKKRLEKLT